MSTLVPASSRVRFGRLAVINSMPVSPILQLSMLSYSIIGSLICKIIKGLKWVIAFLKPSALMPSLSSTWGEFLPRFSSSKHPRFGDLRRMAIPSSVTSQFSMLVAGYYPTQLASAIRIEPAASIQCPLSCNVSTKQCADEANVSVHSQCCPIVTSSSDGGIPSLSVGPGCRNCLQLVPGQLAPSISPLIVHTHLLLPGSYPLSSSPSKPIRDTQLFPQA